jgi:hypothetical protein
VNTTGSGDKMSDLTERDKAELRMEGHIFNRVVVI